MDSYDKVDMIMENGGYSEISEMSVFSESTKPDADVKRQSGFMRLIDKVKELIMKCISRILEFFGFFKASKDIDKYVDKSENKRKSFGDKISTKVTKAIDFVYDHPIITSGTLIGTYFGIDAVLMSKYKKECDKYHDDICKIFDETLEKFSNDDAVRKAIKATIKIEKDCSMLLVLPVKPSMLEMSIKSTFKKFIDSEEFSGKDPTATRIIQNAAKSETNANDFFKSKTYFDFKEVIKNALIDGHITSGLNTAFNQEYNSIDEYNKGINVIMESLGILAISMNSIMYIVQTIEDAFKICTLPDRDKIEKDVKRIGMFATTLTKFMANIAKLYTHIELVKTHCDRFISEFIEAVSESGIEKPGEPITRHIVGEHV